MSSPCRDIAHLVEELKKPAGAIITTHEVLYSKEIALLSEALARQPKWSAIPVLAFYSPFAQTVTLRGKPDENIEGLERIVFVQRPVSATTLISTIKNALRDRERQYQMKELLAVLAEDIAQRAMHASELEVARMKSREAEVSAQNANLAKSQFLANMSHEIRTPLTAIMGFANLISGDTVAREDFTKFSNVIVRNSNQLMRIIDDILDLSKVEAGQMSMESVEFSLPELLWDVFSLLGNRASEKGIGFFFQAKSLLPDRIVSDSVRLRQVMINAVGNAIKFTDQGRVDVNITCLGNQLRIEIADTGRGISEEQAQALFQAFVQADSSTTRKYGGTGLGLVLARKICLAMGGNFSLVKSELNVGSTFLAEIEVKVSQNGAFFPPGEIHFADSIACAETDSSKPLIGHKVLLVEDSPDNQDLFEILLTQAGAEIEIASDGKEGVERALQGTHTVVLMDIQMPVMSGTEATRLLRAKGFKTPIVALTAHAMVDEGGRCLDAGFSDFLTKPLKQEALFTLLKKIGLGTTGMPENFASDEWNALTDAGVMSSTSNLADS